MKLMLCYYRQTSSRAAAQRFEGDWLRARPAEPALYSFLRTFVLTVTFAQ